MNFVCRCKASARPRLIQTILFGRLTQVISPEGTSISCWSILLRCAINSLTSFSFSCTVSLDLFARSAASICLGSFVLLDLLYPLHAVLGFCVGCLQSRCVVAGDLLSLGVQFAVARSDRVNGVILGCLAVLELAIPAPLLGPGVDQLVATILDGLVHARQQAAVVEGAGVEQRLVAGCRFGIRLLRVAVGLPCLRQIAS